MCTANDLSSDPEHNPKGPTRVKSVMKVPPISAIVLALCSFGLPACHRVEGQEKGHDEHHKIVATSPQMMDVVLTQPFVCQIHSRTHIEVRALNEGYLDEVPIREGQAVRQGEVMFRVVPTLYQARLDAEKAKAAHAQQEFSNTQSLVEKGIVSPKELALYKLRLDEAVAVMKQAETELSFTYIRAPFDGIVDHLHQQKGSLVKKEEVLTTLYDNAVMWVYFNVPEVYYLDYMAHRHEPKVDEQIQLKLADGSIFRYPGAIAAIEARVNNETGTIPFRADFPNPDGLLRHGQTGNVLIKKTVKDAVVIPQRATYEILDKQYVYAIGKDNVVHPREIHVQPYGLDDIFVVKSGLEPGDKIVLEGVRQVRDGQKVEYEFRKPEDALKNQKHHAE
jgi:membrane fusion protein (multidrug efflux system)